MLLLINKMDTESSILSILSITKTEGIFIAIIIVCIIFSAFFSMSETVFSSVSNAKLKTSVEDRKPGSKKALHLSENFEKTLTTLLVGNNIVNTLMTVLSVYVFASFIKNDNYVSAVSTAVMTIVLLIFGEITPKTLGKKYADSICYKIAAPLYVLTIVLWPIVIIFRGLQRLLTGKKEIAEDISEDELETILDTMEEEGSIESNEVKLIKNVFDLNDRTVEDIMIHRMDVVAAEYTAKPDEIKEILLDTQYSRLPLYAEDKDHIIGILHERDFFAAYFKNKNVSIKRIMRKPMFVPKTLHVSDLIKQMQKLKTHIAIVKGEYGDTLGIVTMEDALEELVGEIYDEHDEVEADVNKIIKNEDGTFLVDGEIYVDSLYEALNIGDAPEDTTTTLSTWMFEQMESLPKVGDEIVVPQSYTIYNDDTESYEDFNKNIIFTVKMVDEGRISQVVVNIVDREEEIIEE